jgi:hypothetical protein
MLWIALEKEYGGFPSGPALSIFAFQVITPYNYLF